MSSGRAVLRRAPPFVDPPGYARHNPAETLLEKLERLCRYVSRPAVAQGE